VKARKTISGRRKMSKYLRALNPNHGYCECCGTPWSHVKGKALNYAPGNGYFPICELCFYDEQVTYSDLLTYYKREDEYAHTEEQYEHIKNSLYEETKKDSIIKKKHEIHYILMREKKIESIINDETKS
jgi:hypothetical protein